MTEEHHAPCKIWPPDWIASAPFALDDVLFTPTADRRFERAERGGTYLGDVLYDTAGFWFARKVQVDGDLSDWLPMRCVHEARALLVSRIRMQ